MACVVGRRKKRSGMTVKIGHKNEKKKKKGTKTKNALEVKKKELVQL